MKRFLLLLLFVLLPALAHATDLAVGAIDAPPAEMTLGDSSGISFVVRNDSTQPAAQYSVRVAIYEVGGDTVLAETVQGTSLAAKQQRTHVTQRGFRPTRADVYRIRIAIAFAQELRPINNVAETTIVVLDPCLRHRPEIVGGADVYLDGASTTAITLATNARCGYVATMSATHAYGWMVSPQETPVPVAPGAPASFTVSVDRAKAKGGMTHFVRWVSTDGTRRGFETITIHLGAPPPAAPTPQSTTGGTISAASDLDPVNTATGELHTPHAIDLTLGGPLPLAFSRTYAAFMSHEGATLGDLGMGWTHNFAWRLVRGATTATMITDRGRRITFARIGETWSSVATEVPFVLAARDSTFHFVDPREGLIRSFDSAGALIAIDDGRGNMLTIAYAGGRIDSVTDGLGRTLFVTHNDAGMITRVSDGARRVELEYDGRLLVRAVDVRGNTTTYAYDRTHAIEGLMTSTTTPEGRTPHSQTFDAAGRVATQRQAPDRRSTFAYDGLVTTVTDPLGTIRRYEHDARRALVTMTDGLGRTIHATHDANGRRTHVVDRNGDTTRYLYDPDHGRLVEVRGDDAGWTRLRFSERTLPNGITMVDLTERDESGERTVHRHDANGNLVEIGDARGPRWTFTHDDRGRVLTATNAAGATTTSTYNADGTVATFRDHAGGVTEIEYDALRRPWRIDRADNARRTLEYDAAGNVTKVVDETNGEYRYAYDRDNRLVSITDPLTQTWIFSYDAVGRVRSMRDPNGATAWIAYDGHGLAESIADATGRIIRFEFDAAGRHVATIDGAGARHERIVDAEGVVTGLRDPLGNTTRIELDLAGRPIEVTLPRGGDFAIERDPAGRVVATTEPDGMRRTFTYDAAGNLAATRFPENIGASYGYDTLRMITAVVDPNGSTWAFERDAMGRPTLARDPLGYDLEYVYDVTDRVRRMTLPGGMGSVDVTRNARGAITKLLFSDATDLSFSYDARGHVMATNGAQFAHDGVGRIVQSSTITIERDSAGRIAAMTLAPGRAVRYAYDARGNLAEVRDWVGGATTMGYDDAGRRTSLTRPNGVTTTWRYDADGNVVEIAEGTLATLALEYDDNGRVTTIRRTGHIEGDVPIGSTTRDVDAASQLSGSGYAYDAMGRITAKPARTFAWDLASRLKSTTASSSTVTFTYDGFGNRASRVEGSRTTRYTWNLALGLPSISVERDNAIDRRYYIHTPDGMLLHSIDATTGARSFHHYDQVGTTLLLTGDNGAVTDRFGYTPYGVMTVHEGSSTTPFTFVGAWGVMWEPGSDLYQMRARWYDASDARFLSRDPIRSLHPQKLNPYRYALGNPLRYIDPTGTDEVDAARLAPEPITAEDAGDLLMYYLGGVAPVGDDQHGTIGLGLRRDHMPRTGTGRPAIDPRGAVTSASGPALEPDVLDEITEESIMWGPVDNDGALPGSPPFLPATRSWLPTAELLETVASANEAATAFDRVFPTGTVEALRGSAPLASVLDVLRRAMEAPPVTARETSRTKAPYVPSHPSLGWPFGPGGAR